MLRGSFNITIGGQAGSESKGKFAAYIVDKFKPEVLVMAASPNAGHTVVMGGHKYVTYHLPVSWVANRAAHICLGPTSVIHLPTLIREVNTLQVPSDRLHIHPRAVMIREFYIAQEKEHGLLKIGSTNQGVGIARREKLMRVEDITYAKDVGALAAYTTDTVEFINDSMEVGNTVLCEMTQGFDLCLEHGIDPHYCFARGTNILLADGSSMKIEAIVNNNLPVEVLSVNQSTGLMESKKVINWYKNHHNGEWVRVHTKLAEGSKSAVKCTKDHKYITPRGEVRAEDLKCGDMLYTNEPGIEGTNAEQIIIGSLLGKGRRFHNGRINRKPVLQLETKLKEYLSDKVKVLTPVIGGSISPNGRFGLSRYDSSGRVSLLPIMNLIYCQQPDAMSKIVDILDWLGLAVWYQDRGTLRGDRGTFTLFSEGWTLEETWEACTRLNEKFGLSFTVQAEEGRPIYLKMHSSKVHEFFMQIAKYVHPQNRNKLPEEYYNVGFEGFEPDDVLSLCPATVECTGVEEIPPLVGAGYRVRYNIEVEDNHNYFAGNQFGYILVSNCTSKMVNPAMALAEAGVSPHLMGDVYGVFRPYPIRVNNREGSSGPYADAAEITWKDVAKRSGYTEGDLTELTTTTKLPRRVFEFSKERFRKFIQICAPTHLCLQFANYVDADMFKVKKESDISRKLGDFLVKVENIADTPVSYIGTGPDHEDMIDCGLDQLADV